LLVVHVSGGNDAVDDGYSSYSANYAFDAVVREDLSLLGSGPRWCDAARRRGQAEGMQSFGGSRLTDRQ